MYGAKRYGAGLEYGVNTASESTPPPPPPPRVDPVNVTMFVVTDPSAIGGSQQAFSTSGVAVDYGVVQSPLIGAVLRLSDPIVIFSPLQSSLPAPASVTITNSGTGAITGLASTTDYLIGGDFTSASGWLSVSLSETTAPATLGLTIATNLSPGLYGATVHITSPDAVNSPIDVSVLLDVLTPAAIVVSPTTLDFATNVGGSDPVAQTVTVTDGGTQQLTGLSLAVAYGDGAGWLDATLDTNVAPAVLTVTPHVSSLASGTHTATITVSSSMSGVTAQTVSVSFAVGAQPAIALATGTASFDTTLGSSDPTPITIAVTNSGSGTLTVLLTSIDYTDGTGWLTATLDTTTAPAILTLTPTLAGLAVGVYHATVHVIDAEAANTPQDVAVTFTVEAAPVLSLSSDTEAFNGVIGAADPTAATVLVTNGGGGTLSALTLATTYSDGTGWLDASLDTTTAPAVLTIQPHLSGLAAGTYNATVAVSDIEAGNSPQDIAITFTVASQPTIVLDSADLEFSAIEGSSSPTAQTVNITNGGGSTIGDLAASIAYGSGSGWLAVSFDTTTAPAVLTVTATLGALTASTYTATIHVTSSVASNSPQDIDITFIVAPSSSSTFFASATGSSSNAGTEASPWDIVTAFAGGPTGSNIQAGDTLELIDAGVFGTGSEVYVIALTGIAAAPITVRARPGDKVAFNVQQIGLQGQYTRFIDEEICSIELYRDTGATLVDGSDMLRMQEGLDGNKAINLVVHDAAGVGVAPQSETADHEVNGCLLYNNGRSPTLATTFGHGIYAHGTTTAGQTRKIHGNMLFNQVGYGYHFFANTGNLNALDAQWNIGFFNGLGNGFDYLVGGETELSNLTFTHNLAMSSNLTTAMTIGYLTATSPGHVATSGVVTDNYIIGTIILGNWDGGALTFRRNTVVGSPNPIVQIAFQFDTFTTSAWDFDANTYATLASGHFGEFASSTTHFGSSATYDTLADWQAATGLDLTSTFTDANDLGTFIMVVPNDYVPGRGHLGIYNPSGGATVAVDISPIVASGAAFEIYHVYDLPTKTNPGATPVLSGAYGGGTVDVPLTGKTPKAVIGPAVAGVEAPTDASPFFGGFLVVQTSGTGTPHILLSPTSLAFTAEVGTTSPAAKTVSITSVVAASGLAASISYTDGSGWLATSFDVTTTPATLTVTPTLGALAVGTYAATISVTSTDADNSPQNIAVTFTVTEVLVPTTIVVSPSSFSINPTSTQTLTAVVKDQNGNPMSGESVTWSSSDTGVATVDASTGVVTGVAAGTCTITATSVSNGSITGTSAATVAAFSFTDNFPNATGASIALQTYNAAYEQIGVNSASGSPPGAAWEIFVQNGGGLVPASTDEEAFYRYNGAGVPTGDQDITTTVVLGETAGSSVYIFARCTAGDTTANFYLLELNSAGDLHMYRYDADAVTSFAGDGGTYAVSSSHTVRFVVTGTGATVTLQGYVDGVLKITQTDTSASRIVSGTPGLGFFAHSPDTTTAITSFTIA